MAKSNALPELTALAEKHGWELQGRNRETVSYFHRARVEGFTLHCDGEAFEHASWHAPWQYATVVDRRAPGEFGERSGHSLTANGSRRAVGMSEVRAELVASPHGMSIGYLEMKRRIRSDSWRKS